jgi:hypothetical protein
VVPSKERQDNLSTRLAFLSTPSVKFGSYSGSNIPGQDNRRHASRKSKTDLLLVVFQTGRGNGLDVLLFDARFYEISSDNTIQKSTFACGAFDLAQAAASHVSAIVGGTV